MTLEDSLEMLNTKFRVRFCCWITLFCLAVTAEAKVYSSVFHKVEEPNNVILNTSTSDQARSMTECAIRCLSQNCICYSLNKQLQRCDMGNCKASNTSTGTTDGIYSTCNTKAGFKFLTSGSVTACVWESTNKVSYITARDDCRAKSGYLYTLKSVEKLKILQDNFPGKTPWVGLNDMEVEGVYRWEDDNTICDATLISQIFPPDSPNNRYGNENCNHFGYLNMLNDTPCTDSLIYICEQPFFNSP